MNTFMNVFRFARSLTRRLGSANAVLHRTKVNEGKTHLFDEPEPIRLGPITEIYQDQNGGWPARFVLRPKDPYRQLIDWGPEIGRWGGRPIHKWIETPAGRFYLCIDAVADAAPPRDWTVDGASFVYRGTTGEMHVMTSLQRRRAYAHHDNPFINYVRNALDAPDEASREDALNEAASEWTRIAIYLPVVIAHACLARRCRLPKESARRLWGVLVLLLLPLEIISAVAAFPIGVLAIIAAEAKICGRNVRIAFRGIWRENVREDGGCA